MTCNYFEYHDISMEGHAHDTNILRYFVCFKNSATKVQRLVGT